jgi:hypothetical protein
MDWSGGPTVRLHLIIAFFPNVFKKSMKNKEYENV